MKIVFTTPFNIYDYPSGTFRRPPTPFFSGNARYLSTMLVRTVSAPPFPHGIFQIAKKAEKRINDDKVAACVIRWKRMSCAGQLDNGI